MATGADASCERVDLGCSIAGDIYERAGEMGLTFLKIGVANPARPKRCVDVEFLIDSGAVYSVVPATTLRRLGIRPDSREEFFLANGEKIVRRLGNALFRFQRKQRAAPVIFGARGDSPLLGAVTLEALGVVLDPFHRELRPLRLTIAGGGTRRGRRSSKTP